LLTHAGPAVVSGQPGQPNELSQVNNSLVTAFEAVRTAEQQGASNESLAPLITELNEALAYEMNAEQQGNSTAALQSIALSNDVSTKAETIGNQAQTSAQEHTALVYLIAIVLAIGSSIVILEADRVHRFIEKRKLLKSRIEPGEKHLVE
jgi:hypothetical protein